MDCRLVRAHLDAYVDGEIEPTQVIAFEQHLEACGHCRNELSLARLLQGGVSALAAPAAPQSLRTRVTRALDEAEAADAGPRRMGPWAGTLSAAAAIAMVVGASLRSDEPGAKKGVTMADMQPFGMLGDVVARHTDELPADIASAKPEQVTSWFRGKVGFRVQSVQFTEPAVQLQGARVSQVGYEPAVKLYYRLGDSRLTTVVFRPPPALHQALSDADVAQRFGAHRERIGRRVVTYHNVKGYTVPMLEHGGVVYAFTGDLDRQQLLKLVADARLP